MPLFWLLCLSVVAGFIAITVPEFILVTIILSGCGILYGTYKLMSGVSTGAAGMYVIGIAILVLICVFTSIVWFGGDYTLTFQFSVSGQ